MNKLRGAVSIILITLFSIVETSRVLFLFRTRKSNRIKTFKIKISLTSKSHNFYQRKLLFTISLKILLMQTNHAYSSMHPSSQIHFLNSNGAYCNVTYQVACFVSLNSHFQSFFVPQAKNRMKLIRLLLLISGDIHPNPGPNTPQRHTCRLCSAHVRVNERVICCDVCDAWFHTSCVRMNLTVPDFDASRVSWICDRCGSPNFSQALFSPTFPFESKNYFSPIADFFGTPVACSSPISLVNSRPHSTDLSLNSMGPLNVLAANVNHFLAKKLELNQYMIDHDIDILIASETKIDDSVQDAELGLEDFEIYRKDRDQNGGGVLIGVKKTLKSIRLDIETNCELVLVKLLTVNSTPAIIGAFYRPPSSPPCIEEIHKGLLAIPNLHRCNFLLCGDFNLPHIDWSKNCLKQNPSYPGESRLLLDTMVDFGLSQLVNFPTRQSNILDLVLSNKEFSVGDIKSCPGVSDHDMLMFHFYAKPQKLVSRARKIYLYHKADRTRLKQGVRDAYFEMISRQSHVSVENLWSFFKNTLHKLRDDFVPCKLAKSNSNLPWVNVSVRREIRKKERLFKRAKRSGNHIDFASFKTQRKKVKHVIKKAHDDYVDSYILNDFGKKPKKFWKYIKAKRYSNTKIKCLTKNGQTFTETKEILNTLNTTFYEAFSRTSTPSSINELSGQVNASFPDMPKIDISSSGIQALIDGLDSNKAPGPDNISPRLLKLIPEEASRCLKIIFETSLRKSEVPQDWKKAIVTPLYKKGAKSDPKNYRPVSLTSIPCKLLEHIIKSAMYAHLENHYIITDRQHGFRKKYSCTSQLLTLVHSLAESINSKGQTDIIFLDFSKAFDKVCHKKLLSKLQACGIRGENLSWIEGFLFGRSQKVVMDGEESISCDVLSGVPQGSVLGPVLFLIYINDIVSDIDSKINLFADDCALYRVITSTKDALILQKDLDKLFRWSCDCDMDFNVTKCFSMTVTSKRNIIANEYYISDDPIEKVQSYKYLGVYICNDLRWNKTVDLVVGKANRSLGLLRRNFSSCSQQIREKLYFALVRPHLEYACEVWSPHTAELKHRIEAVQRNGARFVMGDYRQRSSVTELLLHLKWDTLESRRLLFQLKYVHKMFTNQVALNPFNYFSMESYRRTRNSNSKKIMPKFGRVDVVKFSFFFSIIPTWNSLPENIVSQCNSESFFSLCRLHVSKESSCKM